VVIDTVHYAETLKKTFQTRVTSLFGDKRDSKVCSRMGRRCIGKMIKLLPMRKRCRDR